MELSERAGRIKSSPTIAVSTRAQELKAQGRDIINLGSGEPDFDTPPHIKEAAVQAIRDGQTKYTAVGGTPELKQAIADKLRRENNLEFSPAQIAASAGAKHAIMNLMQASLNPGDEVIIPAPYWVSYPDMALFADGKPVVVSAGPEDGYKITAESLAESLTAKTKLMILNSPSNPSGAVYTEDELSSLGESLRRFPRVLIVSDDIYEHILYDGKRFANIANTCPDLANRTIVINGVSKAFAMTGWRIGYAAGEESLIKAMTKIQSQATSNPCSIAQAAAAAALNSGTECIAPMLQAFDQRRQMVREKLNAASGISCPPIAGAFYAFPDARAAISRLHGEGKIADANDIAFCEYLLDAASVAAVPGSAFGMSGCFRISFAAADSALRQAMERIGESLA